MNNKDRKRQIAYEALMILGLLALLTFICRLWPILLLIILGIFVAAIRLLFLSGNRVDPVEPQPLLPAPIPAPTESDLRKLAQSLITSRITTLVLNEYPNARWIWEAPNAFELIELGEEVYILLNRAGGYRKAKVIIQNLQVIGLQYQEIPKKPDESEERTEAPATEQPKENYELIAFEWAESHIFELNARCNDAIGQGLTEIILTADDLPTRESWENVCLELQRAGLEDAVCDYMCGSGTTKAAADKAGIRSHLYDLHSGFDIMNCDIPERPEFVFWHPPYWDIIQYSDVMYKASDVMRKYGYDPKRLDLSRIEIWDDFVKAMNYAMMKQFSALENGGRMAVLMGDIKKKGRLYSMLAEIVKPGTLENIIIKAQHNCFSDRAQYSGKFIPILHEYVMIVRKDSPVLIPILMTHGSMVDIRDMPGATWRDVVAAVLEKSKKPVALSFLYEQIEPHKKAQANKWWKEKIRQTLQINPMHFTHDGRGLWSLNRSAA